MRDVRRTHTRRRGLLLHLRGLPVAQVDAAADCHESTMKGEVCPSTTDDAALRARDEGGTRGDAMTSELNDRLLLRAYAESRKSELLGAFVARYERRLLRFATRLLGGDRRGAQDVARETFTHVALRPDRLIAAESCHNWLLKVARTIGISRMRDATRPRRHDGALREETAAPAGDCPAAEAPEAEERAAKVRAAIDRMQPRHRELLLLKVQEEKSYREIAQITGLTVTNVGVLLYRALKELSLQLAHSKEIL